MATTGIIPDEIIQVQRDPWTDNVFRPLIIIVMIMCLNIAVVNFVRLINPDWSGFYFLLSMLLTTIEGIYSSRIAQRYGPRGPSMLRFRVAEIVVLFLLIKIFSYLDKPLAYIGAELQAMWYAPSLFFTTEYYMSVCLALLAWLLATYTIADLETLYDPYVDNRAAINNLAARFFWGGGILLAISGVTQWIIVSGVRSLLTFQRPPMGGVIFNVLIYFVLGLILFSQVNLTRLLIRWRIQKIAIPPEIVKRWAKYSLIFLGLMMLFAFMLPTHYTLGFLTTVGIILQYFLAVMAFILQIAIVLIMLPISWLLSLFGLRQPDTETALPPPPALPPTADQGVPPWVEILRSLIFWLVALVVTGYFIKIYLDDHPDLIKQLKKLRPVEWFIQFLADLWRNLLAWARTGIAVVVPDSMKKPTLAHKKDSRTKSNAWFGLKRLSARERILYYYLNIIQRAERVGSGRRDDQTPYEYEPQLRQTVPTAESEVRDVTDIFVRARYSQEEFDEQDAAQVKKEWHQIKKVLRREN